MRTYKLFATGSAGGSNLASVTIAKTGRIKGIRWSGTLNSVLDNDEATMEVSFTPSSFIGSNDTQGPISEFAMINNGTAGGSLAANKVEQVDIPVALGEKLYFNAALVGTPVFKNCCFIDVQD